MPRINRQTPVPNSQPVFAAGSVLAGAVAVNRLQEERVKVCIYGRNRAGKTTLAAQFPKPLLFISCEPAHCGGVQSVANVDGVSVIQVEEKPAARSELFGRGKIDAIGRELANNDYFQTVVLKTATSLQDVILEEMKAEFPGLPMSGKGSKDTYQTRASRWHDCMHSILRLKHLHIVILAQEKDHNPPTENGFPDLKAKLLHTMQQGSFMAPSLGAANAQWLQDNCGYVIQIYEDEVTEEIAVAQMDPTKPPIKQKVGTGKRARHLRLQYHPNFAAGGKWQYDPNMPEFVTALTPQGLYEILSSYIPTLK